MAGVANCAPEFSVSNLASCTASGSGSVDCAELASPPKLRLVIGAPSCEYSIPSPIRPFTRVPSASTPRHGILREPQHIAAVLRQLIDSVDSRAAC